MNKKLPVTLTLASLLATASAFADWSLVSDFNSEAELSKITDVTNQENSGARSEIVDGQWAAYHGGQFESTSNLFAMLDLGVDIRAASINSGGPVTVFMEITQPIVDDGAGGTRKAIVDTVWGLSNEQPESVLEGSYNSFNVMQRINSGTDAFEGRNGGSYEVVQPFAADVQYSIWLVVDYNLNYYQAYIEGGEWTERTLISSTTEDIWLFRVNPGADTVVDKFLVALSAGNIEAPKGLDVTYFDNIYVDTAGENLTDPVGGGTAMGPGIFSEFELTTDGWVSTGSWMGWVNTTNYPWCYSLAYNAYMYVNPDSNASAGAWVYHPRN
jgi:hypothetical protein